MPALREKSSWTESRHNKFPLALPEFDLSGYLTCLWQPGVYVRSPVGESAKAEARARGRKRRWLGQRVPQTLSPIGWGTVHICFGSSHGPRSWEE